MSDKFSPRDGESAALGRTFRQAREAAGLSLRKLAALMGRSFYIIRRHECGNTLLRADDLIVAAALMGVDPCALLYPEKEVNDDGA